MRLIYTSTFLLVIMVACTTPKEVIIRDAKALAVTDVKSGTLKGDGQEGIQEGGQVINSKEEWKTLISQMNSVNTEIENITLDLQDRTLIAYFDKIRGTGGYSVTIQSVSEYDDRIVVSYSISGPGANAPEMITQPYTLVTIRKTDKKIVFESIVQ